MNKDIPNTKTTKMLKYNMGNFEFTLILLKLEFREGKGYTLFYLLFTFCNRFIYFTDIIMLCSNIRIKYDYY